MGNGAGAMKTMTNLLNGAMADGRQGSEREPGEKLPDGERYFGFVNVSNYYKVNIYRIQTFVMQTPPFRYSITVRDLESWYYPIKCLSRLKKMHRPL